MLHSVAPLEHAPVHMPALQTFGQGVPELCHVPVASQVWGCCPLHWRAPGAQTALPHEPAAQTYGQVAPVFCQVPVLLQVWGCSPEHCAVPGVQTPVQVPDTHA